MSLELVTEIEIDSQAQNVWKVLMDFENYPKRNPFIKSISGKLKTGKKFKVIVDSMKFKPLLVKLNENEEFK